MICLQIFLNFHAHDKTTDVKILINNGLQFSLLCMASEDFGYSHMDNIYHTLVVLFCPFDA